MATTVSPLRVETALRSVTLRGYSRALASASIAAEVSGRITSLNYDVGNTISVQPLLQIDATFINLDLQNNHLALARNNIAQQQAQSRLEWLEKEFKRRAALIEQKRISQVVFEEISQQHDQAELELQHQQQQQRQLEVQRQVLREQQQRHAPHASSGWQVSKRYVECGEWVKAGSLLMDVENYQRLLVPLAVSAAELTAIKGQDNATLNGQPIHYRLHTVSPAFDEKTRKIQIELEVVDYQGEKRGGLSLQLALLLPDDGLMIPASAVINRYERPQVQLENVATPITVHILGTQGEWLRIAPHAQLPIGTVLIPARKN
ncbi:MAG: HlyD family efflux transporter periplasmic adaptor subunit [Desulfuromonas sp.]|nr:HlyD family efflux transporter periplasmic adaptor subunit [Desulfuromonas sp.]